ncbi:hypothetical protein Ddye_006653 [Dipteronia dyeriana]|uniref:RNase H type-1 domain-containing protein n=1 Tax=Dipteronia dyeriana TaxID=168575 RepID=A0AAD9XIG7_9ROSI|nr:hypothetical protein Ddye_006653 [Dipteronia dyeriana]
MATYKGIKFSLDCGLRPCIFESDKSNTVNRIVNGGHRLSNFGHILDEIDVIKRGSPGMKFRCTSKIANRAAQWLAKYGLDNTNDLAWMEDMPGGIRYLVEAYKIM